MYHYIYLDISKKNQQEQIQHKIIEEVNILFSQLETNEII